MIKDLQEFLQYKTLYYDKIDFTIVHKAWKQLETNIDLPYVIHIVGTNGKGTTGRYLASYFNDIGYDVLHYSSPHIVKFNERIWINGSDVNDHTLQITHEKLLNILDKELLEKLTYFEYTTLLALFLSDKKDYIVLEAGLGGEFDATNVIQNDLSLITTIGLDHQSFLGNSVEQIALTKMKSCDKTMIIGSQVFDEVFDVARTLNDITLYTLDDFDPISKIEGVPQYLQKNLQLVGAALQYLNIPLDIDKFKKQQIKGRFEKLTSNIIVDVGHNPLAAQAIFEELNCNNCITNNKVTLVYNSYEDKDYCEVLKVLKPSIEYVEIISIDDSRIVELEKLQKCLEKLNIEYKIFEEIDEEKNYLVFGSFLVVEEFLKKYNEK